jgi:hypothetical protein
MNLPNDDHHRDDESDQSQTLTRTGSPFLFVLDLVPCPSKIHLTEDSTLSRQGRHFFVHLVEAMVNI